MNIEIYRVDCLELFAGHSEISAAFAKANMSVLRPRDIHFGDDLKNPEVKQQLMRKIEEHKPRLICTAMYALVRVLQAQLHQATIATTSSKGQAISGAD